MHVDHFTYRGGHPDPVVRAVGARLAARPGLHGPGPAPWSTTSGGPAGCCWPPGRSAAPASGSCTSWPCSASPSPGRHRSGTTSPSRSRAGSPRSWWSAIGLFIVGFGRPHASSRSSRPASSPASASPRCTTPAWPPCGCRPTSPTTATLVVASVAIAVVAATVALWFTVTLQARGWRSFIAALDHGRRGQRHALHRHVRDAGRRRTPAQPVTGILPIAASSRRSSSS